MNAAKHVVTKNFNILQRHPMASYYLLAIMWAVWHARFDMFAASKVAQDIIPMAMSAMVIVLVLVITRLNKSWNFHRLEK